MRHIKILLDAEKTSESRLHWDRVDASTLVVSTSGYKHQDHLDIEEALLKAGCRYDLSRDVQEFNSMCGRTFTYFKEPKKKRGAA